MAIGDLIPGLPGGGDGGGSGSGGGGGSLLPSWNDVAPDWLTDNQQKLQDFLEDPDGFIFKIIFVAVVGGILDMGRAIINALQILWLGSADTYGIADIPRLLFGPIISVFESIGYTIGTQIWLIQMQLVQAVPDLWLLGPFVGSALVTLEVLVVGWIVWQILRIVDIPGVNLGPLLSAAATPFRALLRVIR
jgi:hypothetical protein